MAPGHTAGTWRFPSCGRAAGAVHWHGPLGVSAKSMWRPTRRGGAAKASEGRHFGDLWRQALVREPAFLVSSPWSAVRQNHSALATLHAVGYLQGAEELRRHARGGLHGAGKLQRYSIAAGSCGEGQRPGRVSPRGAGHQGPLGVAGTLQARGELRVAEERCLQLIGMNHSESSLHAVKAYRARRSCRGK